MKLSGLYLCVIMKLVVYLETSVGDSNNKPVNRYNLVLTATTDKNISVQWYIITERAYQCSM